MAAATAAAKPVPNRPSRPRAPNLFAAAGYLFQVNQQQCGLDNVGEVCVAFSGSPVGGGGFWPKGTPDQYIFNSGLQIAGVIPDTAGGGKTLFPWAGDTVGAFFFDARGDQGAGDPQSLVYSRLAPSDVAAWPNGAKVRDPVLYHPLLLGQDAISQGDVWMRYWEGNPVFLTNRPHPMGIAVDERVIAWNYPSGNEDIIYILYTFYNVTASSASGKYNNPTIPAEIQSEIAAIGDQFHALNEQKFHITLPANGYTLSSVFAAEGMDADVALFSDNYATAFIPFNLGTIYTGTFVGTAGWVFPPDIFGPPFAPAVGFIGAKFLKSPTGLSMFSMTVNSAVTFPDPVGVNELYRYLSGYLENSGRVCSPYIDPAVARARKICFLNQQKSDSRFFQSSGPFTLAPGEASSIVVAYINAAPVPPKTLKAGETFNCATCDLKPGVPGQPDSLAIDSATYVRTIDRIAGWISATDRNGDGRIEQDEVKSVPRSLLDKALVAQAVFDNGFLLPFAPDAPDFYLIPGDNQVTVVWSKSASETSGDPFYAIASQRTIAGTPNPLYDPNFRQFDVEGYRIYRGRTASALTLVAQFDYAGTSFLDYTGEIDYGNACAPELGLASKPGCPVNFDTLNFTVSNEVPLTGDVVQVPPGGRVKLADGSVLVLKPDSVVQNQQCGDVRCPKLTDSGVGFGYVDRNVRNSFTYFYAVTAFDVNSAKSGPSSLESPRVTKRVTPRKAATTVVQTQLVQTVLGGDGTVLNPAASYPSIDADKGTFSGNMPPANDGAMSIVAGAELLPRGDILVRIDSVGPGFTGGIGVPPVIYLRVIAGTDTVPEAFPLPESPFSASTPSSWDFGAAGAALVNYDPTRARLFGVPSNAAKIPVSFGGKTIPVSLTSAGSGVIAGRYNVGSETTRYLAHSRWFDEGVQEAPDPTIVGYPDSAHNAGKLTGVGRIWAPQAYRDRVSDRTTNADAAGPLGAMNLNIRGYTYGQTAWYPGDFTVTWNADSSVSVFDQTHHSDLPFAPNGGSGFGFVNVRAIQAAGLTAGDLADGTGTASTTAITYHSLYATQPTCFPDWWAITCIQLERKAQYEPIDFNFDGTVDANGIALMINGEAFIMEMNAIPAAGTKWHLRAVTGTESATCVPELGPVMRDCSSYTFAGPATRPSLAPGLTYKVTVQQQYTVDSTKGGDLSKIHTVPDPYYVANALEITASQKVLKFVNLPPRCIIRIYSVSGVLVSVVIHDDPAGGGEDTWNLRNRNNQFVASGVYFYHVEAPDGSKKIGRFTVVNFAP